MKSNYSSDCYNAGLFTILAIVLNENAPGFREFYDQGVESWSNLGIDKRITKEVILNKANSANLTVSLTMEFPLIIEKSFGSGGKSIFELGFWSGMLFLSVMSDTVPSISKSIEMLRLKCAEIGNPAMMLNFIKDFERTNSANGKIDIMTVLEFTKENNYWVLGNFVVKELKNITDIILVELFGSIPYIGKAIKKVFEAIEKDELKRD
jgi:hypothetical protein